MIPQAHGLASPGQPAPRTRCTLAVAIMEFVAAGLVLSLLSASAWAAGTATAATASSGLQAVEGALQSVQGNLQGIGSQLFTYLAFIAVVWWAAQLVLLGGDFTNTFGGFMRTVFILGFTYFLMLPYAAGQTPLVWFVDKLTTAVTSTLTGNPTGDVSGIASGAFTGLYGMIGLLMQALMKPFSSSHGFLGGMEAIGVLFANLPMVLFLGLAIVFLWFAGITLFVMATIGLIMFKVADVFAPLFVPFLALPVVSWLFDGWLRFLLSASMYKIAGAVILLLGSAVMQSMVPLLLSGTMDWGQVTIGGMVVAALAFSLLYIMLQLPNIAHGLISGHATVQMQRMMGSVARSGQLTAGAALAAAGSGPKLIEAGVGAAKGSVEAGRAAAKYARGAVTGTAMAYAVGGVGGVAKATGQSGLDGTARLASGALSSYRRASEASRRTGLNIMSRARRR